MTENQSGQNAPNPEPDWRSQLIGLTCSAKAGDRNAIDVLTLAGRLFDANGRPGNLLEYREAKSRAAYVRAACKNDPLVVDRAFDLLEDRLRNLPDHRLVKAPGSNRTAGPDARNTWAEIHAKLMRVVIENPSLTEHALQTKLMSRFRRCIEVLLQRCCIDAGRIDQPTLRYFWHVDGGTLIVLLRRDLSDHASWWLERNIGSVNLSAPGEKERVQRRIDELGGRRKVVHSDTLAELVPAKDGPKLPFSVEHGVTLNGLIDTVAREKQANLKDLPRSIRVMDQKVDPFVRRVLGDVAKGEYNQAEIAQEFGISEPAVSRWCGADWFESGKPKPSPLFSNAASILSHVAGFVEAAKANGVWDLCDRPIDFGAALTSSTPDQRLYFMSILIAAVTGPCLRAKSEVALARIDSMGKLPEYAAGFQQYLLFMGEVKRAFAANSLRLVLLKEGRFQQAVELSSTTPVAVFSGIKPGAYKLVDSSGHKHWAATLLERHLLWHKAYPGQPLALAADDTDQRRQKATKSDSVLGGRLSIHVKPGLEFGSIELVLAPAGLDPLAGNGSAMPSPGDQP